MKDWNWWHFGMGAVFGWYLAPGLMALRHWMCIRRDVLHNAAKMAKRERR